MEGQQDMKIGIVITIHNRPELTRQMLESLKRSLLPNCYIVLVDDASDQQTRDVIDEFSILNIAVIKLRCSSKKGVKQSLIWGVLECFREKCDIVTNLDNDVKLKKDWLTKLVELHKRFPGRILTGFHSTTRNSDGSERHTILQNGDGWCTKKSVGGINMLFTESLFDEFILPSLQSEGNWDHNTCIKCLEAGVPVVSLVPSVIQHTGITESSMGHNQETPDIAADYYERELPDVTLFGLDSIQYPALVRAAEICQMEIKFGHVALLSSGANSKEEYSKFIIQELHTKFVTSHVLVIQHDGYILNPDAWKDEWLQYDYIGATWLYKDGMNVGNGGFSLRSHRLMKMVSTNYSGPAHPEDHVICRTLRKDLESYGMRFAPEEVANAFSIEAYGCEKLEEANRYSGQFGFHGWSVDFGNLPNAPKRPRKYDQKLKKWI